MQETRVGSLGQEDPLEKEMASSSSILAWRIPWTEDLGGLYPVGWKRVGHDLVTKQQTQHHHHREVMLNRLKCRVEGHYSLKVRGHSTPCDLGKGPNCPLIPAKTILNYIMPAGLRSSSPVSLQFFLHTSTRVIFQKFAILEVFLGASLLLV